MKKSCLALKLCHFEVECLDFPMKIDILATLLLNCCEDLLFFKKNSYFRGIPQVDLLFCDDCS